MENHFLSDLNENQQEAVMYCDGPSLIIAGAGSGKTRVLTYKIAYLLSIGMAPWNILALTFTNKAAAEMKDRIAALIGLEKARYLCMGTFHSIFLRILRTEYQAIGFNPNITIYDSSDSRSLIKAIVKEMGLDDKTYKPNVVGNRISAAKNRLIMPEQYSSDSTAIRRDAADNLTEMHKIYAAYVARCRQANAMDFDDLLLYTFQLFFKHPEICQKYKQHFQYVLVDEFQDTNYAQHRILSLLTEKDSRICVVGDDAQSIYGFRGADISNILSFTNQYPTARTFKLECNYRSTGNIVNAANSIIRLNRHQIEKQVYSNRNEGEKIHILDAYSDKEESIKVARCIGRLARQHVSYNEMAILYRTNAQSRIFEETLRSMNIPYRIYGGLSFYQRKEIKDILAYLRIIVNPYDEEALRRIINYPARGIGDTTQKKLQVFAITNQMSVWDVLQREDWMKEAQISAATIKKLQKFKSLIDELISREADTTHTEGLYAFCMSVIEKSGIKADLSADQSAENLSKQENVQELLNAIKLFEDEQQAENEEQPVRLANYLAQVSLLTNEEHDDDGNAEKVSMMTIHSAKGLEFEAVFVVGMEEDLFPNQLATYNPAEMEEERRLFYVALTRAKSYCYLSHAQSRMMYGKFTFCNPSPFLKEIDSRYTDAPSDNFKKSQTTAQPISPFSQPLRPLKKEETTSSYTPMPRQRSGGYSRLASTPANAPNTPLQEGGGVRLNQHIEHDRFGKGQITRIEKVGDSYKATVDFETAGTKTLLLKFARFKTLD